MTCIAIVDKKMDTKQGQGFEPVGFGLVDNSIGANGDVKEGDHLIDANFPKDAMEEWPVAKKIHTFYFVKYRTIENPKLKAKIDHADKEITKSTQTRLQITEALKAKGSHVISQLKPLTAEDKLMEPLQDALGKLRSTSITMREKGMGLCSLGEELNDLNVCYFQNCSLLNCAKDLDAKKDKTSLEEIMHNEVEKFTSEWCSSKAFREDYEKRVLSSLDNRQLKSRDKIGDAAGTANSCALEKYESSKPNEIDVAEL
ncbi:hypothetical protein OPV22_026269 [Ensete ventricosum]|uniref:PDZ domain-containing protein n=1 Tax=Ensete ventricosum TaxID=4639 RepID=A0AAV8PAJ6_ENSVE|nr:hypothetical protein OPV22_026269 [Ensete ventricosum]